MGDWAGTDIVFLNVPSVSWWQWHPFTVAAGAEPVGPGGPRQLVVHMKKYNRWTKVRPCMVGVKVPCSSTNGAHMQPHINSQLVQPPCLWPPTLRSASWSAWPPMSHPYGCT